MGFHCFIIRSAELLNFHCAPLTLVYRLLSDLKRQTRVGAALLFWPRSQLQHFPFAYLWLSGSSDERHSYQLLVLQHCPFLPRYQNRRQNWPKYRGP